MEEIYSAAVSRVLERARARAGRQTRSAAEPVDALVGLLGESEGWLVTWLAREHVAVGDLLTALALSPDEPMGAWSDDPPQGRDRHSPALTEALVAAREFAAAGGRIEPVSTEDLFVSLLDAWPPLHETLTRLGAGVDAMRSAYLDQRRTEIIAVDDTDNLAVETPGLDAHDRSDVLRVIDATTNRAREALRVLEDYARFALDDRHLVEELKRCRHRLAEIFEFLPPFVLSAVRETRHDVGTTIFTESEIRRGGLKAVVLANAKRAQESLRTLEECTKILSGHAARECEKLRYAVYTVERQLVLRLRGLERLQGRSLYWLLDPDQVASSVEWMVKQAIDGGVGIIQLRAKSGTDRAIVELGRWLRRWTESAEVLLIINDRADIARAVHADGVHLGQDDLSVKDARRLLGPDALIGVSTHSRLDLDAALADGADYLGVGPVFATPTKSFTSLAGLDYVAQVAARTKTPAFAIGGINLENLDAVLAAGATRVAVSSAISTQKEPFRVCRGFRERLEAVADRAAAMVSPHG